MEGQPYQSLYRRFRPQRFCELRGQPHVVTALTAAVREGRVGHAYLFSGPRGTGKTSAARILAKALNCTEANLGEPCGACASCVAVAGGSSLDVQELDAASHNGVEAMRELVARAPLGSPGRWKVYIVDEVHMLSTAASNALLKTLEEPPGHVVFVLATTDPHKVLPTIRSRTQHFEFRLLGRSELRELVDEVSAAAGLGAGDEILEAALRRGQGSARDTLSALDQLVLTGDATDNRADVSQLLRSVADRDAAASLEAVAAAVAAGREPQRLASEAVDALREAFLASVAPSLAGGLEESAGAAARNMGLPALVRAMETLGRAQVEMRDALQPRLVLELALFDLAEADEGSRRGSSDTQRSVSGSTGPQPEGPGMAAVLDRLAKLERQVAELGGGMHQAVTSGAGPAGVLPGGNESGTVSGTPSVGSLRRRLGPAPTRGGSQPRQARASAPVPGAQAGPPTEPPGPAAGSSDGQAAAEGPLPGGHLPGGHGPQRSPEPGAAAHPSREQLVLAWGDKLLGALSPRARARFRAGRFVEARDGQVTFGLPDETHRAFCEPCRTEVEAALRAHFGTPLSLVLVVDRPGGVPPKTVRHATPTRGGDRDRPEPVRALGGLPASPGGSGRASGPSGAAGRSDDDVIDLDDLVGEPEGIGTVEERLIQAFPGATEVPDGRG